MNGRERLVNRQLNPRLVDLPERFAAILDYQVPAVGDIVDAFDAGERVVVLDAPTGNGKTLIAECVRRMLAADGAYVCSEKQLQAQFLRDFPASRVLYGRGNYTPADPVGDETCDDCSGVDCGLCEGGSGGGNCPYQVARAEAMGADVAVVNSALWLAAMNQPGNWLTRRGLTVFDEADTLEQVLMGQAEIRLGPRAQARWGIAPPEKMTVEEAYREWAEGAARVLRDRRRKLRGTQTDVSAAREWRRLSELIRRVEWLLDDLDAGEPWVYTGGAGSNKRRGEVISFKPVRVARFGRERIWRNGQRFLLMSATVISAGVRLRDLGWDGNWREVRMESQFPAKNRQVVVRPVGLMTRAGQEEGDAVARVLDETRRVLDAHEGERALVHTVSYRLAGEAARWLEGGGREVFDYTDAAGRERALEKFLATEGAVLVAPSMDRGVDLPGDACRVQVVLKLPLPNLGDRQVAARLHASGGEVWYAMQTAASLMQMVGRAVRSRDDWAVCYVLDAHFLDWRRRWGHLMPAWFARAIRVERRDRQV